MTRDGDELGRGAPTPLWGADAGDGDGPLTRDVRTGVCVVGLGAAGLSALSSLAERGIAAVGIDADGIGGGASGRNGGFLLTGAATFHHDTVARHGRDRAVAIHGATARELDRLAGDLPGVVRRTGGIRLAADDDELADCEAHADALAADGIPVEPYAGDEGRGLLLPADAAFDPVARCRALAARLHDSGLALHTATPAIDVATGEVRTPRATITCDAVVVAVDGCLEKLLPELRGRVRTARAQMLGTEPAPRRLERPVYARWGYDYWQQLPDGRIVLGGARDRGGAAEWTDEAVPTGGVQQELDRLLARVRPAATVSHRWAGLIAFTEDRLPVCEEVRPGVTACGAYSGTGNLLAPLAGRAAVELAVDGSSRSAAVISADR